MERRNERRRLLGGHIILPDFRRLEDDHLSFKEDTPNAFACTRIPRSERCHVLLARVAAATARTTTATRWPPGVALTIILRLDLHVAHEATVVQA
jgi:hypothetical protein